ncbi:SprT family zinc-dependent metalloprotease [Sphingomonas swuensis]|uniref:SprT family zinc-dependent metalloprotease n=1 Tax=Sphingomonas swuensis TaxID=977800 RepID=A0ABP7S8G0_9SPHN
MISEHPGLPLPIAVTRMRRARRMRLRVDHDRKLLKLTVPWRTSPRKAIDWAVEQRSWIDRQLEKAPAGQPFADGAQIPVEGEWLTIRHEPAMRRGVGRSGDMLLVGGPSASVSGAVDRWLKALARERLSALTATVAANAGVTVRAVSIGDPVSRWGSCSSSGNIRYCWRLILAPPELLRFVVAHEVAHRLHMDHSPAFKQAEEHLYGGPVACARSELRRLGPSLRAVGRS